MAVKYDKMAEVNKQKTKETYDKVMSVLNEMIENNEKITYNNINKKTGVSIAFLYKNEDIKLIIEKHRKSTGVKKVKSKKAKDVIIEAQKKKIKELEKYQKDNENYKEKYENILKENKELKNS